MNSVHCSKCVCVHYCVCVCPLLQVCVYLDGSNIEAHYTLYNGVCDKKKTYRLSFFFQNRYPIMVKFLNIGKNIGKPIYIGRSLHSTHIM